MTLGKITNIISWLLIIAILVISGVWFGTNADKIDQSINGEVYYSQEDRDKAYIDGYVQLNFDKEYYASAFVDLEEKINNLQTDNANLSDAIDLVTQINDKLIEDNRSLRTRISEYETKKENVSNKISELQKLYNALELEYASLYETLQGYITQIKSYQSETLNIVEFFIEDILSDIQIVADGKYASKDDALIGIYQYYGKLIATDYDWLTKDGDVIDLNSYQINEDLKLYFSCNDENKVTFNFYNEDNLIHTQKVAFANTPLTVIEPDAVEGYKFLGWAMYYSETEYFLISDSTADGYSMEEAINRYYIFVEHVTTFDFYAIFGGYITVNLVDYQYPNPLPSEWVGNAESTLDVIIYETKVMNPDIKVDLMLFDSGVYAFKENGKYYTRDILADFSLTAFNIYLAPSELSYSNTKLLLFIDGCPIKKLGTIINLYYRPVLNFHLETNQVEKEGIFKVKDVATQKYDASVLEFFKTQQVIYITQKDGTVLESCLTSIEGQTEIIFNDMEELAIHCYIDDNQKLKYKVFGDISNIEKIELSAYMYGIHYLQEVE